MPKQPYIPIYIGDWEQDTNCLSLQAEAAWLKIIFKMFKDDKKGVYKTSTKSLQNLWRSNDIQVAEIMRELKENNVCEISELEGILTFKNRRMIREKNLSNIRSNAVQNRYKTDTNILHPLDTDNDTDTENENSSIESNVKILYGEAQKFSINPDSRFEILSRNPYEEFKSEKFNKEWIRFLDWRVLEDKAKCYLDWQSQESFLKKLYGLTKSEIEAVQIINQAIDKRWKDFYPISKNGTHNKPERNFS